MTQKEFNDRFDGALVQYQTIDKGKCERFGELYQGFVGVQNGGNAHLLPFSGVASQLAEIRSMLWNDFHNRIEKSDFLGVSFVQHYIHYT